VSIYVTLEFVSPFPPSRAERDGVRERWGQARASGATAKGRGGAVLVTGSLDGQVVGFKAVRSADP